MSDRIVVQYNPIGSIILVLFSIFTAIVGYRIHGSVFWSIVDFLFAFIVWIKWLVCQEVNISIIKSAFSFFLT